MSDINVGDTIREGLRSAGEGDFGEAKKKLLLATQQDPENSKAHYNLGVVLCQLGSESKAIKHYTAAINLEPFYKQALMELSRLELRQGRVEEADVLLRRALSKHPYDPELLNSLGNVLMIQGNSGQAKNAYEEALKYNEALPEALANLGMIYESEGDLPAALESYQRAYKLNPNLPRGLENLSYLAQHFCDWDLLDELLPKLEKKRNKLLGKNKLPSESAFFHISVCDDLETNQKFMSSLSGDIESYALSRQPAFSDYPRLSKKIKIGYVSADFSDHPVAHLLWPLFKYHNRRKFTVLAYSTGGNDGSRYRKKIEKYADEFVDAENMDQERLVKRIRADQVDILVDLKGHTKGERLEVFAVRPAPVQVSYMGFPATTGAKFIDYLIADKVVAPPKHQKHYSEKLAYMPTSYWMQDEKLKVSKVKVTREDFGLPEKAFVMACFNRSYKVDRQLYQTWLELLKSIPDSVLWLLSSYDQVHESLILEAQEAGVDLNRIVLAAKIEKPKHLARLKLADVALDTWRVNGHTTTSDALFVGLPVVTKLGNHFASRVSASLLNACGLSELVAKDKLGYVELVEKIARSKSFAGKVKTKLEKSRMSASIFDNKGFTTDLENLYLEMLRDKGIEHEV